MDKSKYGVHRTHCCILHGCKYSNKDCPVVSGEAKQEYLCECCSENGIKSIDEIKNISIFLCLSNRELLERLMDICLVQGNMAYIIPKQKLEERDKLEKEVLRRMNF